MIYNPTNLCILYQLFLDIEDSAAILFLEKVLTTKTASDKIVKICCVSSFYLFYAEHCDNGKNHYMLTFIPITNLIVLSKLFDESKRLHNL